MKASDTAHCDRKDINKMLSRTSGKEVTMNTSNHLSDSRLISWIRSVSKVTRRWDHLTNDQKHALLSAMHRMEQLSAEAVIKNIAKIRRQKCA